MSDNTAIKTKSTDELIRELDTRIRRLKSSGKFIPVPFRSGLGALTTVKLDMLDLTKKAYELRDLLRDTKADVAASTATIATELQFLAKLDGLSLNEAAARSRP